MRSFAGAVAIALSSAAVMVNFPAGAAVSIAEAELLKSTLTPVGAQRAGNAEGTIPPWTGGLSLPPQSSQAPAPLPSSILTEKPLFSITQANFRNYADKLPEGAKALFAKHPTYRMEIYPTHRTAAAPQRVYENIARNATRARAASSGIAFGVTGAIGGIPFPIPKSGPEIVWNHLLAFWGPAREMRLSNYVAYPDGNIVLATTYREIADFPYYYPNAQPESLGGYYFKTVRLLDGPSAKVGRGYLAWQSIDTARNQFVAWRILPGEHRVRRAPSLSYDTPDADAEGYQNLDEYYVFFGGLDRYDFKLLGQQEMYIPYNNNRFSSLPAKDVTGPLHANPEALRYELHRVWVVEGTLAKGAHHAAPRRRLYMDEDTWFAVYSDSWDSKDRLWKFGHGTMQVVPDLPAVILGSQFVYDLLLGGYVLGFAFNGEQASYNATTPHHESTFSPAGLAARAVR